MISSRLQQQMIMYTAIIYSLCLLLTLPSALSYCTNYLNCYKTKLFNFNYPPPDVYILSEITEDKNNDFQILAYGDFNNDLMTDFAAISSDNDTLNLYLWDKQSSLFKIKTQIVEDQCTIQSVFAYDADLDGYLDITIWGSAGNENCLAPYIQTANMTFSKVVTRVMNQTSQPFVISYGEDNGRTKVNALCIFQNGNRTILKLDESTPDKYIGVEWDQIFKSQNFTNTPFADPHWNSYLDLTGDCRGDVVIIDDSGNIQFWVNYGRTFSYQSSLVGKNAIKSLFFADMDYSGTADMIITYQTQVIVYFNTRQIYSSQDFCCPNCKSVKFKVPQEGSSDSNGMVLKMKQGQTIISGPSHIADVDINGYPDLFLIVANQTHQFTKFYANNEGNDFSITQGYQIDFATTGVIKSISFIDFLQNGILDFVIYVEKLNGQVFTQGYFNNFLQQNSFYIKGYGASGENSYKGCQIVGASFFWVNSLGQKLRMAYNSQITQTAYNSLQLPYAYCGLGRANNYVQSFTMGILGQKQDWSPIIPNSQLAVFAPSSDLTDWQVRIFVLPTQALVYVVIVCIVLLVILGSVLVYLKCKYHKKKEQPLMQFLH